MSNTSLGLSLAAIAAFGYTMASFFLKSSLGRGASSAQVNLAANLAMGLLAQALWFFHDISNGFPNPLLPLACAVTFFCGQVFTFASLASGDVSVATPVLGTKILWVTVFNALLFSMPVSARWWAAALAASLGVAVVAGAGAGRFHAGGNSLRTAAMALLAAACFSLTDVFVQHWAADSHSKAFLPSMFGGVALFSVAYYAVLDRTAFRPRVQILPPLVFGASLLGIQSSMVFLSLALTRDATATNVVYSARSLLSVLGAWAAGRFFGLREAGVPRHILALRLAGAVLLFGAIALILPR